MNISFTGVYICTHGNRWAKTRAYSAKSAGKSGFWKSPTKPGTPKWQRSTIGTTSISLIAEGQIRELPNVAPRPEPGLMDRRPIAEEANVEILEELEVGLPVLVMAAFLHLVDPLAAVLDGRIAVLDSGREHEPGGYHALLRFGRREMVTVRLRPSP